MIQLGGGCCVPLFQCKLPNSTSDAEHQGKRTLSPPEVSGKILWVRCVRCLCVPHSAPSKTPGCFSYWERISRVFELLSPGLTIFEASGILRAPGFKGEYSFGWTNITLTVPKSTFLIP